MILDIKEINLPDYATLSSAQVSQSDMGDKVITATIKIDGYIVPDFSYDWVVEFQGEKYIHPLRKPQASKDNTDIRSSIDLTFRHWAIVELQRYFFVEMSSIETGTAIPDKYVASLSLNLGNFIEAFNRVLKYWYGDRIVAELFQGDGTHPAWEYSAEPSVVSISYSHIWDVLAQIYEIYGCRWRIKTDNGIAKIQFGFPTDELDHIFEYGFKGGLLKIERQVQSDNICNILLGRGGEKNVPYRYFKKIDPNNSSFQQDPDWIPELANIYFDRIRDAAFRSYVQGWKYRHYRTDNSVTGQLVPRDNSAIQWAWDKGYNDTKFDPVEFVKDDDSIAKYGSRWGAVDDNDGIYPTIQGITIDPYGRIDQVVAVGDVVTNEEVIDSSFENAAISQLPDSRATYKVTSFDETTYAGTIQIGIPVSFYNKEIGAIKCTPTTITIPEGSVVNFMLGSFNLVATASYIYGKLGSYRQDDVSLNCIFQSASVVFTNTQTGEQHGPAAIPQGTYTAQIIAKVSYDLSKYENREKLRYINVSLEYASSRLEVGKSLNANKDKIANTFDIWVKNIWGTTKLAEETDQEYAERVWEPILGSADGDTARVAFSTGLLAVSEDYEFDIISYAYDTSKSYDGVSSEWRLTLGCSQADFDTLGVLIPNEITKAAKGDYFFFLGIDLPYLYYTEAEKRLTAYKEDELAKISDITPTWVVNLDKVRIGREQFDDVSSLISQIVVGASIRLADERFIREKDKAYEVLYVQSITYNYNEPSKDDPYIVPDVEIVLSDSYTTTANPVAIISGEIDALQKQLGSISNIEQIVRIVSDRLYLRKDGITDLSYSPTLFNSLVTSKDFRMGNIGGAGWGFYRDANGNAVLELDRAIFRQSLEVNNLVVNQVVGKGGMEISSAASMECSLVVDRADGYYCYFDQKQGSIGNLFAVDDIAYCNRWDAENKQVKFYKRRVKSIGVNYIVLTKGDASGENAKNDTGVNGEGIPERQDNIIQYGNYTDKNRQFVIIRNVVGGAYDSMLEGLDSVNATGYEYFFAGCRNDEDYKFYIGDSKHYMQWTPSDGLIVKGKISSLSTYDDSDITLGETVQKTTPYYNKNNSETTAPEMPIVRDGVLVDTKGWTTTPITSVGDNEYVWQTLCTTYINGKVSFSAPNSIVGKAGENAYILSLTREMVAIACDSDGNPTSVSEVSFKATVYSGTKEADGFSFKDPTFKGFSDNDAVKMNGSECVIDVTKMSENTASVTIYATNGTINLEKVFTLYKVLAGADGKSPVIYSIQSDVDVITKTINGELSATEITVTKYSNSANDGLNITAQYDLFVKREGEDNYWTYVAHPGMTFVTAPVTDKTTAIIAEYRTANGPYYDVLDRLTIPVLTDVSDLSIGGTNLLYNTNQGARSWTPYFSNNPFEISSDTQHNGVLWTNKTDVGNPSYWQFCQFMIPNGVLLPDRTYTLSFNIASTVAEVNMSLRICLQGGRTQTVVKIDDSTSSNGFKKFTFTMPSTFDPSEEIAIQFNVESQYYSTWETIRIWNLMLEEGNIATSWQPSPHDIDYLKKALVEEGSIEGGLILGSHIRLGYTESDGEYVVKSGLNGIYAQSQNGGGAAFWAGGEMVDAAADPLHPNRAAAMIRMDGTGYLADNTVRFRGGILELGNNLVLSENTLTLGVDGQTCVAFGNQKMPDNLEELASALDIITESGRTTNVVLSQSNGLWDSSEYRNVFELSPVTLTNLVVGTVANLTIRVRLYVADTFDGFDPSIYHTTVQIGDSLSYDAYFSYGGNSSYADIYLPNIPITDTTLTIKATMYGSGFFTATTQIAAEGSVGISDVKAIIQRYGMNMTLIGSNGFFSSWNETAMGVNQNTAILRAGSYGILANVNDGIKIMLDGKNWLTLRRRSDDGALLLD